MTRRSGTSRTTSASEPSSGGSDERAYPSLRQRNPMAYWIAIMCVVAMVVSTIALSLSAFL